MGGGRKMKIGIDARYLSHPQDGGFKTYTQNIVHGLMELDHENEYILYTDRPGVESHDNFSVKIVSGPAPVREQALLPLAMARDKVDIAHFPFNTGPLTPPCPTVLTVHDLIPLLPREKDRRMSRKMRMISSYWRTITPKAARRASRIITISEASKSDIQRMLNIPEEKISVVPTGLNPDFHSITDSALLKRVRETHGLPERFILGLVSSDPRKNCRGIVGAAGLVSSELDGIGIVLICASPAARDMAFDTACRHQSHLPRMVMLAPVSRQDLTAIYTLADVLVFPSFYEGFGLPVIEAMACGTPVVTSNISSMPEVAGDAAVLVDPNDPEAISRGLMEVLNDKKLREKMIRRGRERAAEFSWKRTAKETIAVYKSLISLPGAKTMAGGITG
ncbi:MAG: glycosyltransferase family 1 protein [Armatimonadota bacterium]